MLKKRRGLLGGTFDPVHNGHLTIARAAIEAFDLDDVIFLPAGQPWQKSSYSDAEDRLMMVLLAVHNDPRFSVSRLEIDRRGPSYTVQSLRTLQGLYSDNVCFLLIAGSDTVNLIPTWREAEALDGLAEIICVPRPGHPLRRDVLSRGLVVHELDIVPIDDSATAIREDAGAGHAVASKVPAPVARYIEQHGLYSSAGSN